MSQSTDQKTWPIRLVDHRTTTSKILYDVEGNILVDNNHRILNIYRGHLDEAMEKKEVRLFRNSTMGKVCYRYFITSDYQLETFLEERKWGTTDGPNKAYHVYVDEDTDINSDEYKLLFCISRECN